MRMGNIYRAHRVRAQLDIFNPPTHKFVHSKVFYTRCAILYTH